MVLRSVLYILMLTCVVSCNKDKVPVPDIDEPTKWELISGKYKVYDTLGMFLYDMTIVHVPHPDPDVDSLRFENFDGEFTFTAKQQVPEPSNIPMMIRLGVHDTLYDSQNKRWKLGGGTFLEYNRFINDTIPLRFQKTNINYWIEDIVPYFACDCKQIAVKQH